MTSECKFCKEHKDEPLVDDPHGIETGMFHLSCYNLMAGSRNTPHDIRIALDLVKNTGYLAAANAFTAKQPVYYDKNGLFWFWNNDEYAWEYTDETEVLNMIRKVMNLLGDSSIKHSNTLIEAIKQVGREKRPKDLGVEWVQFKNTLWNVQTGETKKATSEYFCTNPIPWKVGASDDTPTMDRLISSWVNPENLQTIYEIFAYSCYRSYPISRIFVFLGGGRNGKSQLQNVMKKFVGDKNITTTDLELLDPKVSRFESFKLYHKLVCLMGETDYNVLNSTSLIKRLVGGDPISYEAKGKMPFTDNNYAKLIISSNSLPSTKDTSEGFWRRWQIIEFPHDFPEGPPIYLTIPDHEYESLAHKIMNILPGLLRTCEFTGQGSIEERRKRYISASNPLPLFIENFCHTDDPNGYIRFSEFYTKYVGWLAKNKRRIVSKREIVDQLTAENFEIQKTSKRVNDEWQQDRFILSMSWGLNLDRICDPCDPYDHFSTPRSCSKNELENASQASHGSQTIFDEKDILRTIISLGNVSHDKLVAIQTLADMYPGEPVDKYIALLKQRGEIYEPINGRVGVVV